jgi:hypothetical protein
VKASLISQLRVMRAVPLLDIHARLLLVSKWKGRGAEENNFSIKNWNK